MKEFKPYSKEVMKHFVHPKNMGKMKNPDGVGEAGNIYCGDIMKLYLKIRKNKISDIKFECLGCVVAIANTSLLTTMVKGKKLIDVLKITKEDILRKLGQVPVTKIHCSILALDALNEAIFDYYSKNNLKIPSKLQREHERIQQTVKTLESKYRKYLEFEKKVLEKK